MRAGPLLFPDASGMSLRAAGIFVESARDCLARSGGFSVGLSGGKTPIQLFRLLSSGEYVRRVDWGGAHLFWVDERCVQPESPDSNYGNARAAMLDKLPLPPGNIHRIKGELPPGEAADEYEADLKAYFSLTGKRGFDLCLLGVGEDGHTASLFAGTDALYEKARLAVPVYAERLASWRVTVTLPVINASARVVFLASGRGKAPVLRAILAGGDAERAAYPAGLVHPEDGELLWLLDGEAASLLGG